MESESRAVGRPLDPSKDQAIVAEAGRLLYGEGPQAVTIEAVARGTGISKPTIYRRYANRDELITAAVQDKARLLASGFDIDPDSAADLHGALLGFAQRLTDFILGPEHMVFVHAVAGASDLPLWISESIFRNGPQNTHRQLADWLARAGRKALLDCADPDYSAELFMGMLLGLNLVRSVYRSQQRPDTAATQARLHRVVEDFLSLHGRATG